GRDVQRHPLSSAGAGKHECGAISNGIDWVHLSCSARRCSRIYRRICRVFRYLEERFKRDSNKEPSALMNLCDQHSDPLVSPIQAVDQERRKAMMLFRPANSLARKRSPESTEASQYACFGR